MSRYMRIVLTAALTAIGAGCAGPKSGVDMTPTLRLKVDAHIGKSWNDDGTKIANLSTQFSPNETVLAAVDVPGSADGTMKVRWMFGTEVLKEQSVTLDDKTTLYKFELAPAAGGNRVGDYEFQVLLNDHESDTEHFKVTAG